MADPREFVLIGRFDDGITPELAKINNQLASLKQSFSNLGGKGARNASRDIGRFKGAVESLNETLKIQNKVLRSTIEPMRQYRKEVGKTVSALKKLDEVGGRSIGIERTNKALAEQIRLMDQLRSRSGRGGGGGIRGGSIRPPRESGGGGARPPRSGGGGGGGDGYNFHMGAFAFGMQMGQGFAQPVTAAIMSGFQIGISFMTKPFEYFVNNLGERMEDELSDLKAAGGLYSIAQRQQGDKFVKTFDQAIEFTQANNRIMAKLAASLPGSTQDYIEVGKRISDGIARTVMKDTAGAIKLAESIRAADVQTYGAKQIEGQGAGAQRQAMQVLMGEITKQTVLAGIGGGRAGGAKGAYGLPQLTERMISDEEISVGKMQKYAAIFGDPAIQDALARNVEKINATSNNSAQRMQAILAMYKEIVTPELVERYRRSMAGIMETFNTAIFGKETGIFGIGRKMQGLGKKFNEFGQMIDWYGKVTTDVTKQANESLAIYDLFRDIVGNIGQVLAPIVENLTLLWDPLRQLGLDLGKAREFTYKLLHSFNVYKQGFQDFADSLPKAQKEMILATKDLRASLLTIGNLFTHFGVYSRKQYDELVSKLKDPKADLGKILSGMIDTFFDSEVAQKIGEFFGKLVGTVLTEVAKVTGFISKRLSGNMLSGGFFSAFEEAGGIQAISNIIGDVLTTLFNLAKDIIPRIPLNVGMLAGAMIIIPAVIAGLFMSLAQWMTQALQKAFGMVLGNCQKMNLPAKAAAQMGAGCDIAGGGTRRSRVTGGGIGTGQYRGRPQRYGAGGSIERLNRMRRARYARAAASARANAAYAAEPFVNYAKTSRVGQGAIGMAKGAGRFAKGAGKLIPGGALAAGAIDMGLAMATGENFGKAAVGAIGTVLGATAGTVFGPVGTAIGATLGGMLADASSDFILGAIDQNHAAKVQLEAAQKQIDAASTTAQRKYGPDFGAKLGGVEAINEALGGGAGVKAYAEEQLRLGKILPEQAQSWSILGTQLTDVNKTTAAVEKAQKAYDNAVKLTTGEQKKYEDMLKKAKAEQEAALSRISANWESMSSVNRIKLLGAADNIKAALDEAAGKIRGWNPRARTPENPNPTNTPLNGLIPSDPNKATIERRQGIAALQNKYRAKGQQIGTVEAAQKYDAGERYKGGLGDAIASEMKHKPLGSDLVIANSSETVIPAAGGYGMKAFLDTLGTGFTAVKNQMQMLGQGIQTADANSQKRDQQTNTKLTDYHNQTQSQILKLSQNLSSLTTQVATMGGMGGGMGGGLFGAGMGGAGVSKVIAVGKMLQGMGLNVAENPAFGSGRVGKHAPGSYHYSGRAIDVTGSDAQLDAAYAKLQAMGGYAELLWRTAGHYDHLHVAYALGQGNPAFFSSQRAAENWEASMAGRMNVRSVTGNTTEGFGGSSVGDIYVTVNAGATNDPDQLAYMVAERIQAAVGDAVNANILV